jgi:hypothetical protein
VAAPAHSSRLRNVVDALWVVSFAASLTWLLLSSRGDAGRPAQGLLLELRPGVQQQLLFRRGKEIGQVQVATRREGKGWIVERRVFIDDERALQVRQELRGDLSLARLSLAADLDRLATVAGLPLTLLRELGGAGTLTVAGPCKLETGSCQLEGRLGSRVLRFPIFPGRGPVLTEAVYPLLARGRLGRTLELSLFDPLSLQPRRVTLRVLGSEILQLPGGPRRALHVRTDLEGVGTDLWLDPDGMPLREELPLGLRADHEWWRADDR